MWSRAHTPDLGPLARWLALGALCVAFAGLAGCKRQIAGGKADGARIFAEACATCHGTDGSPSAANRRNLRVKDLTDPVLQERLTDDAIRRQIKHGSSNRLMPAFGDTLNDAQVEALVKFVRGLRRK